jgi:polyhydroxyalkanoate synthesis regulator phasin
MQTQDDDFPYTSDDPSLSMIEEKNTALSLTSEQLGDLKASLRLFVGSALNGKDAYTQRLRRMQAAQKSIRPEAIIVNEDETFGDQLKFLLLGMLFETPDLIQQGLQTAEQASSKVLGLISKILSPVTNSWMFSPVKDRYDYAATRGEKVVDRLIMKGRMEEQNSRQIVQQKAIDDLVNEVMEYIILKTEVKQLLQEEGVSMAGDMLGEFREQSEAVDSLMEQKLRSLFGKRAPSQAVTPPGKSAEGE